MANRSAPEEKIALLYCEKCRDVVEFVLHHKTQAMYEDAKGHRRKAPYCDSDVFYKYVMRTQPQLPSAKEIKAIKGTQPRNAFVDNAA